MVDLILDESIDARIFKIFNKIGFSTLSIGETYRGFLDEDIIDLVKKHNSILITEDSDFGEWVFSHGKVIPGVIFLRYHFEQVQEIIQIVESYLTKNKIQDLYGKFITITTKKIRIREIPGAGHDE